MLTSLSLAYFARESSDSTLFQEEQEEQEEEAGAGESSPFAEVPPPAEQGSGEKNP
jgi:hypothetical protein